MRLNDIILEQQKRDDSYATMMVESNIAFWSTLVRNESLPLSESVMEDNMIAATARLYEVAFNLPENKRKQFWKMLESPMIDEDLIEGAFGDASKKVGNAALSGLAKVGDTAKAAKKVVGSTALKGAIKIGSYAKEVYNNRVPVEVKEKIKAMGEKAIQMVKEGIQKLTEAGTIIIKALDRLVKKYSKSDPCMTTNENLKEIGKLLSENTVSTQYFTGTRAGIFGKIAPELAKVEGALPVKLAKTISELKKTGTQVFGRDVRGIAIDIVSKGLGGVNPNEATQIANKGLNDNKYFPMSSYFKDNGIKALIKRFDSGASGTGEGSCEIPVEAQNSLINKVFGPDTEMYKALDKLGAIRLLKGLTDEIKKHPGTFIISLISAIVTISSGAGALRIAAVIFGSVLPMLGNTYVEYLKTNNAPEEKIAFAEKIVSALRGIATIAQIININDIAMKGWSSLAASEIPPAKIPQSAAEFVPGIENVSHEMSDLSSTSQEILSKWTYTGGNLELSPKVVKLFFDQYSEHMTPEQFKEFDELVTAAQGDSAKYQELVKVFNNPETNGVINIDMGNISVTKVLDSTELTQPLTIGANLDVFDSEQIKYFTDIVGKENTEILARYVYNGQLDVEKIKQFLDTGNVAGQTPEQIMTGIDDLANLEKDVPTDTVSQTVEVPDTELDKPLSPEKDVPTSDNEMNTSSNTNIEAAQASVKNIANDLEGSTMMSKLDDDINARVSNKIMNDFKNNPDFAKAWESEGFDKDGYIEQLAKREGWFEPLDKTELVKDLKAAGIEDQKIAQSIGTQIQKSYEGNPSFRAKWDGMNDVDKKAYLSDLKDQALEIKETEMLAKGIMSTDPKVMALNADQSKYMDGLLRNDKDMAASWETMDEASKDAVIARAKSSADFQSVLLKDATKAFKANVDMDGRDIMNFGSAVADGNYTAEQIEQLKRLTNLAYGEESMAFRKAVSAALKSGDKVALKTVIDGAVH